MTSHKIILIICWVMMILDWTTEIFAFNPWFPFAFLLSWAIMDLAGMFTREKNVASAKKYIEEEDAELTDRQREFKKQMAEGKRIRAAFEAGEDVDPDPMKEARVNIVKADGSHASILIHADGTVETEGNPPEDLVQAVKMLRENVLEYGPEIVARELSKQLKDSGHFQ